jgi:GMP synthase-like glutamine amidotransferase
MLPESLSDEKTLALSFASQKIQNITRRIRECQVNCEIHPGTMSIDQIVRFRQKE